MFFISTVLIIAGVLVFIFAVINMEELQNRIFRSKSEEQAVTIRFFIGIIMCIIGAIMYFYENKILKDGAKEYEKYTDEIYNINKSTEVRNINQVECWQCPKCGRVNKNYVGTCGCGERKRN